MVNSRKQGQIVYLPFFGFQAALMRISRGSLKTVLWNVGGSPILGSVAKLC